MSRAMNPDKIVARNDVANSDVADSDVADSDVNGFKTIKKRVGGGFKYVKVKVDVPKDARVLLTSTEVKGLPPDLPNDNDATTDDKEHDFEEAEKATKDENEKENHMKSPTESYEGSFSLPLLSGELWKENTCDRGVDYGNYPILKYIQENVIGHNVTIPGPFGPKRLIYCDYTASGRSLAFIEDYIRMYVCPFYANTHSDTGRNARQTSKFRTEARQIIKRCVNASKDDVVIFTGSGATAGFHKLAWGLKINHRRIAEETVVLTGPYEHHANLLLWKELGTTVIRIRERQDGKIDLEQLVSELKFWKEKRRHALVCISAASNVTGIITDVDQIATLSHQYGALCILDYAGGGPYLDIDMNPSKQSYKDAVIISPHKFVGGPGSPGVIIAKRWMFKNQVPERVGGGTVTYVSREFHNYTHDIEAREEGGTPAIIESIRTGLAFQLKAAVTEKLILARDEELCCRAFTVWERNPNLVVLGSHTVERLTIFSFVVTHETGKFVHHNFISTLLNDLFGIQSRGGCACAGPYGHDLLGISEQTAKRLKWFTVLPTGKDKSCPPFVMGIMRPGFVRVNLPYFYDDKLVEYIINAVDMVATHGWKLLPLYTFDTKNGAFVYKGEMSEENEEDLFSLQDIDYPGKFHVNRRPPDISSKITIDEMLQDAERILIGDSTNTSKARVSTATLKLNELIPKDKRKFRWFLTPQDASDIQTGTKKVRRHRQFMTLREDNRINDWGDCALESYRSQASDKQGSTDSTSNHLSKADKNKRSSGNLTDREDNRMLDFGESCDECESDRMERYKPRKQYSKTWQEPNMAFMSSPRRMKDGSSARDKDNRQYNKSLLTPRSQHNDFHLPKIV